VQRELHHALDRNEFRLAYQGQVDVASGRLCGAEALVRWQHPTRGLLGPCEFIGAAEDSGLIVPPGAWELREALQQLAQWRRGGLALPQTSVNVSSLRSRRVEWCDDVRQAADVPTAYGFNANAAPRSLEVQAARGRRLLTAEISRSTASRR
jgi:EAL domain-containing protein (putative c-di-GMP-specific phosphodiesterase class I)